MKKITYCVLEESERELIETITAWYKEYLDDIKHGSFISWLKEEMYLTDEDAELINALSSVMG